MVDTVLEVYQQKTLDSAKIVSRRGSHVGGAGGSIGFGEVSAAESTKDSRIGLQLAQETIIVTDIIPLGQFLCGVLLCIELLSHPLLGNLWTCAEDRAYRRERKKGDSQERGSAMHCERLPPGPAKKSDYRNGERYGRGEYREEGPTKRRSNTLYIISEQEMGGSYTPLPKYEKRILTNFQR